MQDTVIHIFMDKSLRLKEEGNTPCMTMIESRRLGSILRSLTLELSFFLLCAIEAMELPKVGVKEVFACSDTGVVMRIYFLF